MSRASLGAIASAALAASCGLLGDEPGLVLPPANGVNDFGPASPIELCLGSARVVSPALAAALGGAVCVAEGARGDACSDDAGCEGIERCICGVCVVEACVGAGACGDGRICRGNRCTLACGGDQDCADEERCAGGGCARRCSTDDGCHFGERCDSLDEACATKLCGGSLACAPGDVCLAEQTAGELHEPTIVSLDGRDVAFVELRVPGPMPQVSIYRARIDSPTRWTADPETPVMTGAAPSAIATGGDIELFFAAADGSAIERATSADGGSRFGPRSVVLEPELPWERGFVGSPSAVRFKNETILFYEGGPRAGIGMARFEVNRATRLSDEPIGVSRDVEDPVLWRGVREVRAPAAVVVDDVLRVYFTARGAEGSDAIVGGKRVPAEKNDSIGLLATRDLSTFDVYPGGPAFARVTNLRTYLGESEAFVRIGTGVHAGAAIDFVGGDASGRSLVGLFHAGR